MYFLQLSLGRATLESRSLSNHNFALDLYALIASFAERRPVAMRNAALSVRNLKRSLRVLESLGVDPSLGASADLVAQVLLYLSAIVLIFLECYRESHVSA